MSSYLWRYYLENDSERFQRVLRGSQPHSHTVGHRAHRAGLTTPTGSYKSSSIGTIPTKTRPGSPPANVVITKKMLAEFDALGRSVLHLACTEQDRLPFVKALLTHPLTDPTLVDQESGWTCLHRALYHGNITVAREIILSNASSWSLVKSKDHAGDTPFDVFESTIEEVEITPEGGAPEDDDGSDRGSDTDEATLASRNHSMAMGDEVFSWGSNKNMTLGFIDGDDRSFPERIPLQRPRHLLLEQAKRRYHNRPGNQGKLAEELLDATVIFNPIRISEVVLSKFHTAILTDGPHSNLFICGFGRGGRLGFGEEQNVQFTFRPLSPPFLPKKRVKRVALGQDHTVVVLVGGDVYTWGRNQCGQLGYALPQKSPMDEPIQSTPRQVFGLVKRELVIGCAASRVHTALFTEDSLFTFGKNDGQLGILDSSDAQTLEIQSTPRKVSAIFLNGGKIMDVVAVDKATVILLKRREVWILAGYGYSRLTFPMERFVGLPAGAKNITRYGTGSNSIMKITGGGDTICALSQMGDVFTLDVDAALREKTTRGFGKGSWTAQRAWSLRKKHMAVRDVDVGAEGNIIICTQSGSVWSRVKRAKIKESGGEAERYKFDRVPGLTRITSVRSNTTGTFAAIRRDSNLMRTRLSVEPPGLWDDVNQMLSFGGLFEEDDVVEDVQPVDEDDEEWGYGPKPKPRGYLKAIAWFAKGTVEEELRSHLADLELREGLDQWDMTVSCSKAEPVDIPVHSLLLSRSPVLRKLISGSFGSVPGVCEIALSAEKLRLVFHEVELLTVLNLVYYLYVDTVIDLWHRRGTSKAEQEFFRSLRTELSQVAGALGLAALQNAVGRMLSPPRCLNTDLQLAYGDPAFFETADMMIDTADGEVIATHSALMRVRCPFFDALYGEAGGRWLVGRQMEGEPIHVDMKHVPRKVMDMVVSWLYCDWDVEGFDGIQSGVKDGDVDQYLDFLLDVLATANELMLGRLSQICQKVIGRYVNTRNAAGLLSACAPCSEKSFKRQCLQYICSNLETMLESHLLDELGEDLMAELDDAVRANQKRLSSYSRAGRQEQRLLEKYPTMKEDSEKERVSLIAHYTAICEEQQLSSSLKFSPSSPSPQQPKRKTLKTTAVHASSLAKPVQQGHDDIFSMDDDEIPRTSPPVKTSTGIDTNNDPVKDVKGKAPVWGGVSQQSPRSFPQPPAFELPTPPPRRSVDPWQAPPSVKSDKLGLKEIMSQAAATASGRSALTAQLAASPPSFNASPKLETPQKLSQKERRRQQQQQQQQQQMTSPLVSTPPLTPDKKVPWSINPATSTLRVPLKEVLASSPPTPAAPPSVVPLQPEAAMTSPTPKSPAVQNFPSAPPQVTSPPVNCPQPSELLPLSLQDIIDQEEAQKVLLKEYQMKRSLQEIQEEQEFLQWWEAESRRVREEEARRRERERKSPGGRRGGRGGRGGGGGGSGGRGKGKGRGGKPGGSRGGDADGGEGSSGSVSAPAPGENAGPGLGPRPRPRPSRGAGRRHAPPTAAATTV